MRSYLVDELSAKDTGKLRRTLRDMELASGLDGLFWLPVQRGLLSPAQVEHLESCGPYVMGLEVEEHSLRLELLVRARGRLHCECVGYASPELQTHMIAYLDQLLTNLGAA